jgi:hypothetical protein
MNAKPTPWLLLITNLPGRNQTLRMRVWRALKAAGAGLLRDGVYVLPHSSAAQKIFEDQALEIQSGAGTGHIILFQSDSTDQQNTLLDLFDRTSEYQEISARLDAFKKNTESLSELETRRILASIARDVAVTSATDFFAGKPRDQILSALTDAEAALNARFSPNEPRAARRRIPSLDAKNYRGRTWATRKHLWVDRVGSAWLIQRFIDRQAKFVWLKRIEDKPKRAIGFDFDGATFTHVDSKVTFEVLLASFGLEGDRALARLGALVHFLDVGGIPVPEASGFAAIVSGARTLQPDDDALLKQISPVLDSLYETYTSLEHVGSKP